MRWVIVHETSEIRLGWCTVSPSFALEPRRGPGEREEGERREAIFQVMKKVARATAIRLFSSEDELDDVGEELEESERREKNLAKDLRGEREKIASLEAKMGEMRSRMRKLREDSLRLEGENRVLEQQLDNANQRLDRAHERELARLARKRGSEESPGGPSRKRGREKEDGGDKEEEDSS